MIETTCVSFSYHLLNVHPLAVGIFHRHRSSSFCCSNPHVYCLWNSPSLQLTSNLHGSLLDPQILSFVSMFDVFLSKASHFFQVNRQLIQRGMSSWAQISVSRRLYCTSRLLLNSRCILGDRNKGGLRPGLCPAPLDWSSHNLTLDAKMRHSDWIAKQGILQWLWLTTYYNHMGWWFSQSS